MTISNGFFDRIEGVWENSLNGVWQDNFGWNFISQPKPGDSSRGDFNMRFDQMRERIIFTKLDGIARNIGISGEAGFWDGMRYEIDIATPQGESIHQEMGHFLLHVLEGGETEEALSAEIIRQAVIPRANAFMTAGMLAPGSIRQAINGQQHPFYNARPKTHRSRPNRQAVLDEAFASTNQQVSAAGGPDFNRPLEFLADTLNTGIQGVDWVFAFRDDGMGTSMASGQRVEDPVRVGKLFSDFWIGGRDIDGTSVDVLQYAQVVDLHFAGSSWPHVAINSLIRQA